MGGNPGLDSEDPAFKWFKWKQIKRRLKQPKHKLVSIPRWACLKIQEQQAADSDLSGSVISTTDSFKSTKGQ